MNEMVQRIEANMVSFGHKWVSTIVPQFIGLSPIPLEVSRMTRLVKPVISGSTKFLLNLKYSKEMNPCLAITSPHYV